jgi:putative ABC transport system ATP-binding protein
MQMLRELHEAGMTVCIATHDPRWIALAPKHVYLFDGAIVEAPAA